MSDPFDLMRTIHPWSAAIVPPLALCSAAIVVKLIEGVRGSRFERRGWLVAWCAVGICCVQLLGLFVMASRLEW